MFLSIVIPAYNEEKLLGDCLSSVFESCRILDDSGRGFEVLVCDNNSTDSTAEIARAGGARVVFESVNQIGRARNCGAGVAEGQWLLFIDADSVLNRDILADTLAAMENLKVVGGGSTLCFPADTHKRARRMLAIWNRMSRIFRLAAGSYIFCRRTDFEEIGGFDDAYYAAEEIDLVIRLRRLARRRGQKFVILSQHPLCTSARKFNHYSMSQIRKIFLPFILFPKRSARNARNSSFWYHREP